ncbi:MAG: class I SAM-dependent methyltransferase [Blastocatellia bacterium]
MKERFKRALYRFGWDTRCRNLTAARLLRAVLQNAQPSPVLLDVGCGRFGIQAFLKEVEIVGVDKNAPTEDALPGFALQRGDVTALPFPDRSFTLVSCVDVLENLSLAERDKAIKELVRVASCALLIACPHGQTARACDEEFLNACQSRSRPVPDWVREHQDQSYPATSVVVEQVHRAARESGRTAKVSISYCEPAIICRLVRAAAARSRVLYAAANLLFGALFNLLPAPGADNSYRMIVLAELS